MVYQPPKYAWASTVSYSVGAQVVGERLEELAQKGPVTPHRVVEDATPEDSPLHPIFEWDNESAAHAYRVGQARKLIRSVAVVYETPEEPERKINAFVSISSGSDRSYVSTAQVLSDAELRTQAIGAIVKELTRLQDKMRDYEEFASVLAAIDDVRELAA